MISVTEHGVLANGRTLNTVDIQKLIILYNPSPVRFYEDKEGLRSLLFAHKVNNIRLSGQGTIDGQGSLINRPEGVRASMPRNIWFGECEEA